MNQHTKGLLSLLAMVAALGYTWYNYTTGKVGGSFLLVAVFALALPFMNILGNLIDEWKKNHNHRPCRWFAQAPLGPFSG